MSVLPFGSFAIGGGWFLKWPEAPWIFDLRRGASVIPVGLGIGRVTTLSGSAVLVSISDETSAIHAKVPNAPENTIRLTLTIFVRSTAPK